MNNMNVLNCERWKTIKFRNVKDNMYQISDFGNLRNIKTNTNLHPWKGKNGYLYGTLMCSDNKPCHIGIHVLVALHFIDIPDELKNSGEKLVPNHKDFNKLNNYYKNLEWNTYAMNNKWNIDHGHYKKGEECPNSLVNDDMVHLICQLMEEGYKNNKIIKILGKSTSDRYFKSLMTRIRTGKSWKHISSQYKILNKNTLRHYDDKYINKICKLIDGGKTLKEMKQILNIPNEKEEKDKFKKLVWFIYKRKSYKDISDNYNWWK